MKDNFAGFEVQARRWWFPMWLQCGGTNTHSEVERAEAYALHHSIRRNVVKYLGRLPPLSDE